MRITGGLALIATVGVVAGVAADTRTDQCRVDTPADSPVRFVTCSAGDRAGSPEGIWAIITPGSHCVAGEEAGTGRFECDDGTSVRLAGPGCALVSDPGTGARPSSCTFFPE
ncbi:MAG: hypothetical protein P1V51_15565 [Deltaproteobacteria bacterium]|nr:hypothetical protein [Deltaproteobacteria bacterium]